MVDPDRDYDLADEFHDHCLLVWAAAGEFKEMSQVFKSWPWRGCVLVDHPELPDVPQAWKEQQSPVRYGVNSCRFPPSPWRAAAAPSN
jgi:hypothetical protein